MPRTKIKYKKNQKLGKLIFIEEVDPYIINGRKIRKALFL